LEAYYQEKLDGVRAKREGSGRTVKETAVRVRVDPQRNQVVLSWKGDK
jgi:hypothetical protein